MKIGLLEGVTCDADQKGCAGFAGAAVLVSKLDHFELVLKVVSLPKKGDGFFRPHAPRHRLRCL